MAILGLCNNIEKPNISSCSLFYHEKIWIKKKEGVETLRQKLLLILMDLGPDFEKFLIFCLNLALKLKLKPVKSIT